MEWPTLPTAEEYAKLGCQFTPMDVKITASAPVLSADSVKTLYHSQADYLFAQDKAASAIPAGLLPYRVAGQDSVFAIPASPFKSQGILFA